VLYYWHSVGNRFLTLLSNMLTDINLSDAWTCYKVFRREVLDHLDLTEDRFGFEVELTAQVAKAKLRIYEVAIDYHGRTYAEGKKITWRDGYKAIWQTFKHNVLSQAQRAEIGAAAGRHRQGRAPTLPLSQRQLLVREITVDS